MNSAGLPHSTMASKITRAQHSNQRCRKGQEPCSSKMHSSQCGPVAGHKLLWKLPLPHASERVVQQSWGLQHSQSRASHLDVRLLLDPVEVLMQPIQQRPQQLLAVLLPISSKLGTPLCNLGLELARSDIADVALQWSKGGAQSPMQQGQCSLGLAVRAAVHACTGLRGH